MARKKRAWGPSNALWRWQHGLGKKKNGGHHMARRRRFGRRGRSRGSGGILMRGLLGKYVGRGLLGAAIAGAATVFLAKQVAPDIAAKVPGGDLGLGAIGGGIPGAAGALLAQRFMGSGSPMGGTENF